MEEQVIKKVQAKDKFDPENGINGKEIDCIC
jgi:hypothetical protein